MTQYEQEYAAPQDLLAEQLTIGGLLEGHKTRAAILQQVTAADFWREAHQLIVRAVEELAGRRDVVTAQTVATQVRGSKPSPGDDLVAVAPQYLEACLGKLVLPAHAIRAAGTVREMAQRRRLQAVAAAITTEAADVGAEFQRVANTAAELVMGVVKSTLDGDAGLRETAALRDGTLAMIERAAGGSRAWEPVRFGVVDLDRITFPLCDQRLTVVKGSSGVGKTQFAVNAVCTSCKNLTEHGRNEWVLVFSFEGRGLYQSRALSWLSYVDNRLMREGFDGATEEGRKLYAALRNAEEVFAGWPLMICEDVASQAGVESRIRVEAERRKVGMVVIDHWQQLQRRRGRREIEEYDAAAQAFRNLADELACPIVVLSQTTYSKDTGTWSTKNSQALHEAAYLDIRIVAEEEKGQPKPSYSIHCDKTRITPYFRPIPIECDWGTSRIISKQTPAKVDAQAEAYRSWHDN